MRLSVGYSITATITKHTATKMPVLNSQLTFKTIPFKQLDTDSSLVYFYQMYVFLLVLFLFSVLRLGYKASQNKPQSMLLFFFVGSLVFVFFSQIGYKAF